LSTKESTSRGPLLCGVCSIGNDVAFTGFPIQKTLWVWAGFILESILSSSSPLGHPVSLLLGKKGSTRGNIYQLLKGHDPELGYDIIKAFLPIEGKKMGTN